MKVLQLSFKHAAILMIKKLNGGISEGEKQAKIYKQKYTNVVYITLFIIVLNNMNKISVKQQTQCRIFLSRCHKYNLKNKLR